MSIDSDAEQDAALVSFVVTNPRGMTGKALFALVDVEMQVAGVSFMIFGVQARHISAGGTSVHLPNYKDRDGTWRPAIRLPEEVSRALGEAVLEFLIEAGLARPRFTAPSA